MATITLGARPKRLGGKKELEGRRFLGGEGRSRKKTGGPIAASLSFGREINSQSRSLRERGSEDKGENSRKLERAWYQRGEGNGGLCLAQRGGGGRGRRQRRSARGHTGKKTWRSPRQPLAESTSKRRGGEAKPARRKRVPERIRQGRAMAGRPKGQKGKHLKTRTNKPPHLKKIGSTNQEHAKAPIRGTA